MAQTWTSTTPACAGRRRRQAGPGRLPDAARGHRRSPRRGSRSGARCARREGAPWRRVERAGPRRAACVRTLRVRTNASGYFRLRFRRADAARLRYQARWSAPYGEALRSRVARAGPPDPLPRLRRTAATAQHRPLVSAPCGSLVVPWRFCRRSAPRAAGPAAAAEPYTPREGRAGRGPGQVRQGLRAAHSARPKAKRVLVLVPGFLGGAGDFRLIASDIVKRVTGLQVWAIDRRPQAFEDTSVLRGRRPGRGRSTTTWASSTSKVNAADVPFVGQWGLKLALEDLRRWCARRAPAASARSSSAATRSARRPPWPTRRGTSTAAPATSDLDGHGAHRRGPARDPSTRASLARGRRPRSARSRRARSSTTCSGSASPRSPGILAELAALYARKQPDAVEPAPGQPADPAAVQARFPVTNEGALGYAFDKDTSPQAFSLIRINAGRLAASGNPRPWQDGELTPIQRFADGLRQRAPERHRLVFPPPPAARRGRHEPAQAHRGHPAAGPAALPCARGSTCRCTRSRPT